MNDIQNERNANPIMIIMGGAISLLIGALVMRSISGQPADSKSSEKSDNYVTMLEERRQNSREALMKI